MTNTDPKQTHLNKRISFVDDFSTDGRPDTLKIYPAVQKQLREAQKAYENNPSFGLLANINWLKGKVAEYAARARARQS